MNLAYTIITIDDSRRRLKEVTHRRLREHGLEELGGIEFVDGRVPGEVDSRLSTSKYKVTGQKFHNGEIGLWLSTINALEEIANASYEHVIVLDDDAVVCPSFGSLLPWVIKELPEDYDFFAWAVPPNQRQDYYYQRAFNDTGGWTLTSSKPLSHSGSPHYIEGNEIVCRAYQGYRTVATMYSPRGARRILELTEEKGIYTPIDLLLFQEHHVGRLNGYTFYPNVTDAIDHKETGSLARGSGMFN